ncbi:CHAT domain-containing protein [Kitasatospora sp. NPDC096128]|uniref:CHAT domain-containing protein n=1 Tax=Kitasatospora sp. NPDC096128 TaxID=3155547 RepID=UPI00332E7484
MVHDLDLELPPGWLEAAGASGSVVLVVSHVLPATDDLFGALTFETRQGMVCAGSVHFGELGHEPEGEGGADPDHPTVRFLIDPVGELLELADFVCERILSLDQAKYLTRELERTRQVLAEYRALSAETMLALLFRDEFIEHRGLTELMFVYWRLVTELADAAAVADTWRVAALRTVECAVPLVASRGEQAVFDEADAVSARLIAMVSDSAELEAALLAAARLRVAMRGAEYFAADEYARGGQSTWVARLTAELYRTWFTDEEPFQGQSHRLLVEAADLAVRALRLNRGTRRPRLLALLAVIYANEEGVDQEAARAALSALLKSSTATEPDLLLFLLRTVDEVHPDTVRGLIAAVFGTPLADFVAAHGTTMTSNVISQGINLAREHGNQPLLRTVLSWVDQLSFQWDSAHRRQLIEARLHVLPGDPTTCPSNDQPLITSLPSSWTSTQRSAALLHMAAHARDREQSALGLALLRQAEAEQSEEVRLLAGDLHHQAAEAGTPIPGPLPIPWGYYSYAALAYASLGFEELARASLVPFVQQLGNLQGQELQSALHVVIVYVPNFHPSGAPELAEVLRDLVHTAVWQLAGEIETLPMALMLGLHQVGKGAELGAWWRIDGPLALPGHIQHFVGRLRDLEEPASVAGGSPGLLNFLDADLRPAGRDHKQLARNLRWRISSFIDNALRSRTAALIDDQHLWARAHELLDDQTVLLSWFLPMYVGAAAVLLAITRQGRTLAIQLGDAGDGEGESQERHRVADQVEAIRTEIQHDPLFADMTPEGLRLLELSSTLFGGNDYWEEWRAQGKNRLLVWPHGALHYLPAALCRPGGRVIADDWTVITIAGLDALAPVEGPIREHRTAVLASASGGTPYGLYAEPALEDHARKVAEAVGTKALIGPAANRAALLAELSTADVVHVAAHGTMDQDAPWMHCLYLTPDGDDDGRVFAHDFLTADLRGVRLVTLAACESALGRFDRGDNVRGIPSALITAGAQAVVGCLWPVQPEPATYFYYRLHHLVAHGVDPVQAFRDAQLATRARYTHYRDWGAFTYLQGRSKGAAA